jgi:hypothetical protein
MRLVSILLCLLFFGFISASAHAQGVAMVLDRAGNVESLVKDKAKRVQVLDYLAPDSDLRLAAGASATLVYLGSSREWQFVGPGRYRLRADQPVVVQGAAPKVRAVPPPSAQAMARLEPAQRERLALGAMVMRGDGPLRIVSPNGVDLLDPRPTLIWLSGEAQEIAISVFDAARHKVSSGTSKEMQWSLPQALAPGDYTWRIESVSGDSGSPRQGRFRVLGEDDERYILKRDLPADFAARVAHAVLLESQDLPHDALRAWRALAEQRPDEDLLKQWAR